MSKHESALVPIEAWAYSSPDVKLRGQTLDVGLFAEALLYYDRVLLNVGNPEQFAMLLKWFVDRRALAPFLRLFEAGHVTLYDYAFISTAIEKQGVYSLFNIQDELQARPNSFEARYFSDALIGPIIPRARQRERLYRTIRPHNIEVKADEFGNAVENARADSQDPRRSALLLQAFVDEYHTLLNLGPPPQIHASVSNTPDGRMHTITWNLNLKKLEQDTNDSLGFHLGSPLTAAALANRCIWSAAEQTCDLYLGRPLSVLAGDKLAESHARISKPQFVIDSLQAEVDFPDLRALVNQDAISFDQILDFRNRAGKFRAWLQTEAERDRNALIAYHNEVAKEAGWKRGARKSLGLFGALGAPGVGAIVGSSVGGTEGAIVGGVAGSATRYILDVASKMGDNWKPVVFGNWLRDRVMRAIEQHGK